MSSQSTYKKLSVRREILRDNLKDVLKTLQHAKGETRKKAIEQLQFIENSLHKINSEKQQLIKSNEVIVTEHALLRYVERVLKIDLEEVKTQMLPDKTLEAIRICRTGKFPVNDFKLIVKNGVVTTIMSD